MPRRYSIYAVFSGGIAVLALALSALAALAAPQGAAAPPRPQIAWLGDLEVALKQSSAERRPLLIAVNMDGESAAERIVREQYRDPAFVALTDRFVCLVASAFRHTPRDFDDAGARVPCPRLGRVTCGEHMALEPLLFDRYLGGERIAPRHAVVLPDGSKVVDLFLQFDLGEIDRALETEAAKAPAPTAAPPAASRVSSLQRMLAAAMLPETFEQVAAAARELGVEAEVAAFARELLGQPRAGRGGIERRARLFELAARLDGAAPATRSLLLASLVVGAGAEPPRSALEAAFGAGEAGRVAAALEQAGGPLSVKEFLGHAIDRRGRLQLAPRRDQRSEAEVRDELAAALAALDAAPGDAAAEERVGRASLALARLLLDSGGEGVEFLLADAENFLSRAQQRSPRDLALAFDLARAAFVAGKAPLEEERALAARALLPPLPGEIGAALDAVATSAEQREAVRWVGDAAARRVAERFGGDAVEELRAMRRGAESLLLAAAAATGDDKDWQSAASFLGAIGLPRHELAVLLEGLERNPAADALRADLNLALWRAGRPELGVESADGLAERHPDDAACAWYAGYARMLDSDWRRREEAVDAAIAGYERAESAFERSLELNPDFAGSVRRYRALCAQSRGFAHLLAERRVEAAACLIEAVRRDPGVAAVRDGLDRETVDLIDGVLEVRASGASPVAFLDLLDDLTAADPANAAWARRVADSALREALRADGRGEPREGDLFMKYSYGALDRAAAIAPGDPDNLPQVAQINCIIAERLLQRGITEGVAGFLARSAAALGVEPVAPPEGADRAALEAFAAGLRERIGEPRPVFRPGR